MPENETQPSFFVFLWFFSTWRERRGWKVGKENTCLPVCTYVSSCHYKKNKLCSGNSAAFYITCILLIAVFNSLEAELYREIRIQMRAKDLLESSVAPIDTSNCRRDPQSRTATKTKQERLGFLQDRSFSFKPRINPTVPDFEELYWAFQREAVRRQEIKEATQIKPFKLRTSNLRGRQREANEKIKVRWPDISVVLFSLISLMASS